MNWYLEVLKKYAVFGGRARRMEYWMFYLFNLIISLVLMGLDALLGTQIAGESGSATGVLGTLYSLAVLIPSLAVTVRRLHDTDRSGWWILIALVPLIGGIVLLVFMVMDGTRGPNRYGPDPKLAAPGAAAPPAPPAPPAAYPPAPGTAFPPAPAAPMTPPAAGAVSPPPPAWEPPSTSASSPVDEAMDTIAPHCPRCGAAVEASDSFCGACGSQLGGEGPDDDRAGADDPAPVP